MMNHVIKTLILSAAIFCGFTEVNATVYTAIASGTYNQASIWQYGIAPPAILNGDTVVIPLFEKVYMTGKFSATGSGNRLHVNGWLHGNGQDMDLTNCEVAGSGYIDNIDSLTGISSIDYQFSGSIATDILLGSSVSSNASLIVFDALYLPDTMVITDAYMELQAVDIFVEGRYGSTPKGPSLQTKGTGRVGTPAWNSVYYRNGNVYTGLEWLIASNKITIQLKDTNRVILSEDIRKPYYYVLEIESGILDLNGHQLTIRNTIKLDKGVIASNRHSSILCTTCPGRLRFLPSEDTIMKLSVTPFNCSNNLLSSNLYITDTFHSQSTFMLDTAVDMRLLKGASLTGVGQVVTLPAATLSQYVFNGDSVYFPVSTMHRYGPCRITSKNNTEYDYVSVNVRDGIYEYGGSGPIISLSQSCVNLTWDISCSSKTSIDYDLELIWNIAAEFNSFDRNHAYISNYKNSNWDRQPFQSAKAILPNTLSYSLKRTNITNGGVFAVLDRNANMSTAKLLTRKQVSLYPNPAKNLLSITVGEKATANVYSTSGQAVLTAEVGRNNNAVNISHLPAGMYFVQLLGEEINGTARFIKE